MTKLMQNASFELIDDPTFLKEFEQKVSASANHYSDEQRRRFSELMETLGLLQKPWLPLLHINETSDLDGQERTAHEDLAYHFRVIAIERFFEWATKVEGRTVDVLGPFNREGITRYFDRLSFEEQGVLHDTLLWRRRNALQIDFDINENSRLSPALIDSMFRNVDSKREKVKILAAVLWSGRSETDARILSDGQVRMFEKLWKTAEIEEKVGWFLRNDEALFDRVIPDKQAFKVLTKFLEDFEISEGKYVWPHKIKELARLLDHLFGSLNRKGPLIPGVDKRYKRATEWFAHRKGVKAGSLSTETSRMKSPLFSDEPPLWIDEMCDRIATELEKA